MSEPSQEDLQDWLKGLKIAEYDPVGREMSNSLTSLLRRPFSEESVEQVLQRIGAGTEFPIADLLQASQNKFSDALPESYDRLKTFQESLFDSLKPFFEELSSHQEKIERAEEIWNHYEGLADDFETIEEARNEGVDLKGLERVDEDAPVYTPQNTFGYNAPVCLLSEDPPLRFAAFARLSVRRLKKDEKVASLTRIVMTGLVRGWVLRRVLMHYEITGVPPAELEKGEARQRAEELRSGAESRGGRPKLLDEEKFRKAFLKTIGKYADCWHEPGDRYEGVHKKKAIRRTIRDNQDLLTNPNTDQPFDFDYLRTKMNNFIDNISEEKLQEQREKAFSDE